MSQAKSTPTFETQIRVATKLARIAELNATSREFAAMARAEVSRLTVIRQPSTDAERRAARCQIADHQSRMKTLREVEDLAVAHEPHREYITRQFKALLEWPLASTSGRLAETTGEAAALVVRLRRFVQRS